MHKLRKLIPILMIALVLFLLLGCTPEKEEPEQTVALPNLTDHSQPLPTEENGSDPVTEGLIATDEPAPADTSAAAEPAPTEASAGIGEIVPATEELIEEEESNTDSTYTFVVGDGYGVGGN